MANGFIDETPTFDAAVKEIQDGEDVDGGVDGPVNLQAKNLANRTLYLKQALEAEVDARVAADSQLAELIQDEAILMALIFSN